MLEIVRELRYVTIGQLAALTGEPYQNVAKKLRRLEKSGQVSQKKVSGRSMYYIGHAPRFADHELLITDLHVRLYPSLKSWKQPCRVEGANPDALYETDQGTFWLEVERSNPRSGEWLDKCWAYLGQKGRIHFDLSSKKKAENLCQAIRDSGIRHLGKFWVSWRGNDVLSPNRRTYQLCTPPGIIRNGGGT